MSQMVDDELLEGEDDDDGYDITTEREEVLLQDDEDFQKGEGQYEKMKKSSYSDTDDADDVLNLHVDEDFQDDDKLLEDEEELGSDGAKRGIKSNTAAAESGRSRSPVKVEVTNHNRNKESVLTLKNLNSVHQKANKNQQNRKPPIRNDKWKRHNGRGNNQLRSNYVKNNATRRRNGTVLINPRYEGTVRINDNSARLAWDNNGRYSQNSSNMVQPWNGNVLGSANLFVSNLVSGLASSLAQHSSPNILVPQQTNQNFYEPPSSVNYQASSNYDPPLAFEPPPRILEESRYPESYNNQTQLHPGWNNNYTENVQVSSSLLPSPPQVYPRELSPPIHSRDLPPRAFSRDFPPPMNHPPPMTPQNTSNSYSNSNSYSMNTVSSPMQSRNLPNITSSFNTGNPNFKRYNSASSDYNTYHQNSYPNKSFDQSDYSFREGNFNSYSSYDNMGRNNVNAHNTNYRSNQTSTVTTKFRNYLFQQSQLKNQNKFFVNNAPISQQNNNFLNRPRRIISNSGNNTSVTNRIGNRQPLNNQLCEVKNDVPEKKIKLENVNKEINKEEKPKALSELEEDEETRLYRLKIEEQKRERERILKIKEERRRQMILQKEEQEKKRLLNTKPEKQNEDSVKNDNTSNNQVVKKNSNVTGTSAPKFNQNLSSWQLKQPPQTQNFPNTSSAVSSDMTDVSNLTFKVCNNRHATNPPVNQVAKSESSSGGFMSNRVIVVKSKNSQNVDLPKPVIQSETNNDSTDVGQGFSSFFNNRKVLKKDNSLLNTRLVIINNLSSSINHDRLMALCRGIGEIQQLRVDKQERQATILFKSVASAHAFFKKYQRRILDDLSVIEVKLEPMI